MLDKIIPLWLKNRVTTTIWIVTTSLIAGCWFLDGKGFLIQAIGQLEHPIKEKIIIELVLLQLGLLLTLLHLARLPNIKDYDRINPPGFQRHKKTGAYFCQPCLIQKRIASELSTISRSQFLCRVCKETYEIDYTVLIHDEYLSMVHDRAAEELIHKRHNKNKV